MLQRQNSTDKPYVGVTGYTSLLQVEQVHRVAGPLLDSRVLVDGLLVRAEDVSPCWRRDIERRVEKSRRFVSLDEARAIVINPSDIALRIVHFLTLEATRLDEQLDDCLERLGPELDGFQINWLMHPDASELAGFRRQHDARRKALGLGPSVMVLQLHPDVSEPYA